MEANHDNAWRFSSKPVLLNVENAAICRMNKKHGETLATSQHAGNESIIVDERTRPSMWTSLMRPSGSITVALADIISNSRYPILVRFRLFQRASQSLGCLPSTGWGSKTNLALWFGVSIFRTMTDVGCFWGHQRINWTKDEPCIWKNCGRLISVRFQRFLTINLLC